MTIAVHVHVHDNVYVNVDVHVNVDVDVVVDVIGFFGCGYAAPCSSAFIRVLW